MAGAPPPKLSIKSLPHNPLLPLPTLAYLAFLAYPAYSCLLLPTLPTLAYPAYSCLPCLLLPTLPTLPTIKKGLCLSTALYLDKQNLNYFLRKSLTCLYTFSPV